MSEQVRTATRRFWPMLVAAILLVACAPSPNPLAPSPPVAPGTAGTLAFQDREFRLVVPAQYDRQRPAGLVVALHGFTADVAGLDDYFGLSRQAGQRGLLLALPDGTQDSRGDRFWNATGACCDMDGSGVDDSGYLSGLIDLVKQSYAVDPARVLVVGHSNGGFMAHRLACDHADQVTGIASLAGPQNLDRTACAPSRPVSVLQIQGTADDTIDFAGTLQYPSAAETVRQWVELDSCTGPATDGARRDLDRRLAGAETEVTAHAWCRDGTAVELWTIEDGRHSPDLTADFGGQVLDWLLAHSR